MCTLVLVILCFAVKILCSDMDNVESSQFFLNFRLKLDF